MKINKIHINAFGKLSNFDLVLNDGLNLIYGDNEYGKSTLMTFIKMIFFGTASGKAGIDRKKYIPWGGGKYAGSIDFEESGVPYRIEREFAATNSHDKIRLINLNSSAVQEISPKENLGERLFGCTLACFERTLFIGALNDSDTESTVLGEINKKLANIVSSGDEDISANTVSAHLLDAKHRFLSKGGKIGVCDKAKLKAEELKNVLLNEKLEYAEKERQLTLLSDMKAELDSLQSSENEFKTKLKNAQSFEKAATVKDYVSCCNQLEALKLKLTCKDGSLLTQNHIYALKEQQAKIESLKNTIEQKSASNDSKENLSSSDSETFDAMAKRISELSATAQNLKNEIAQKESLVKSAENSGLKAKISPIAIILCCLAAVLLTAGVVLNNTLSLPLYCGGAVLFVVFAVLQITAAKNAKVAHSNYIRLREEILADKEKLQALNNETAGLQQERQQHSELKLFAMRQKEEELTSLKENLKKLEANYRLFFENLPSAVGFTDNDKAEQLSLLLNELNSLESKVQVLGDGLNGIDLQSAQKMLDEIGNLPESLPDTQKLQKDIEDLQSRCQKLSEEYHRLENAISVKYHSLHIPATVERELNEIQSEISKQEEFCNAIDAALQVLEEASDEMQSSWGGELNGRVSEIFSRITGEKYSDVLVSKSLSLSAEENGSFGLKGVDNLSAGTKDQSYFSLRLALCDLIFGENNAYPLFLDDSFERYDDTRAKRALEFLKEFSDKKQVLFFTCHKNLKELLEN